MSAADYILYGIWFLFPLFFLGMALFVVLERISGAEPKDEISYYLKQAGFTFLCVLVSLVIDRHFLQSMYENMVAPFVSFIPLGFFRIVLLPFIFFAFAKLIGGSKTAKIERVSRVGLGNPRRKATNFDASKVRSRKKD